MGKGCFYGISLICFVLVPSLEIQSGQVRSRNWGEVEHGSDQITQYRPNNVGSDKLKTWPLMGGLGITFLHLLRFILFPTLPVIICSYEPLLYFEKFT